MSRSEGSVESKGNNNEHLMENRTTRKQTVTNFFDYEEDDVPIIRESDLKTTNQSSSDNKFQTNTNAQKEFLFGGDIQYGYDINRRIMELVESDINSITSILNSPSSGSSKLLSTRQAVDRIFSGDHNVNLSLFKSKEQKLELLDYALLTGDKYTMTKVILYLEQTLKPSIFFYELVRRSVIADHYLLFLKNTEKSDQQLNVLNQMGRYEDAAFATYARASKSSAEPQQQIKFLERSLLNFPIGGSEIIQWQSYIRAHITLLEHQLPIETDDQRRSQEAMLKRQSILNGNSSQHLQNQAEDDQLFVIYPKPCLLGISLMETLRYCCLYHFHLPDNNFASPFHLRKAFHISDRQFLWMALQSLAKTACWTEIDKLFEYKSWLGSRKIRNVLPITDIIEILYRHSSPPEMLEKYLDLVDDSERRLQLAKEFHMNKYAADILIKLRDRKRLQELRSSIQTKSEVDYVQRYVDNAIISSSIKWKN